MKVIVTGGAGFIGSHITELLIEQGYEVIVIDSMIHGKRTNLSDEAKLYEIDIRDKAIETIFRDEVPDYVIHHAAQISVPYSIENPIIDADVNILGTINLLENSVKYKIKKFIYPGSAASFGEPKYLPIDENHPLNMFSGYGVSKHTVEHYLKLYYHLYELDFCSLNYSNVYGPRQDASGEGAVVAVFVEKLMRGEQPNIFGDGEQTRDFVFVEDVARANLTALESNVNGTYNVSTNIQTSINELLELTCHLLGKDSNPIYHNARVGDIKESYMSFEKIRRELGWEPQYSIEKGLSKMIEFYRKEDQYRALNARLS